MNRRTFLLTAAATAAATRARAAEVRTADVLVYGGVPCGTAAAIAAARAGAKVLLVEPTAHVGGLSTSGINTGETEHMLPWTIGGIAREFYDLLGKHYGLAGPAFEFESGVGEKTYLAMLKAAGVEVVTGVGLRRAAKDGTKITGVTLDDGTEAAAKVYVDAGYEGDLMAAAGVPYAVGREGRDEYKEEAAGVRLDAATRKARTVDARGTLVPGVSGWAKDVKEGAAHPGVMNYNFRLTVAKDPKLRVPFPEPKAYDRGRYALLDAWLRDRVAAGKGPVRLHEVIDLYPRRNGKYEMNNKQAAVISLGHFGGQFEWPDAAPKRRAELFRDHLDYTLGLLKFLATDDASPKALRAETQALGLHKDEFADNGHLPYQLYVREARRMRGAAVVAQADVQADRRKPDAVGMSSHFIDCHHVQRLAVSEAEFVNEGRIWRKGFAYQIPYRALTPKSAACGNLLVPGAASFTHVAFCTLRLESVWMITGHAAGVAAAAAATAGAAVQDVDVPKLQDRLRDQKQVVDFVRGEPEKCEKLNGPPEF